MEKPDGCKDNPENSSTTRISEHILSRLSMFTISSFRRMENKVLWILKKARNENNSF